MISSRLTFSQGAVVQGIKGGLILFGNLIFLHGVTGAVFLLAQGQEHLGGGACQRHDPLGNGVIYKGVVFTLNGVGQRKADGADCFGGG